MYMKELKAETINDIEKNILKISTKLFLDQGYDNTTIRQIAEASGIGRGHLYYYFRKKEDILIHIFKQILNKIYNDVIESSDDKTEILLVNAYDRNKGNIISENPIIDTEKGTVTISVKTGTDLSSIFLTCGLSSGANISPALDGYSDWSSKTKTFTVTSASGTRSQQWTIILN